MILLNVAAVVGLAYSLHVNVENKYGFWWWTGVAFLILNIVCVLLWLTSITT